MKGLKLIGLAAVAVLAMSMFAASAISSAFLSFSLPTFTESVGLIAVITLVIVACAARAANRVSSKTLALKVHKLLRTDADTDHNQGKPFEISWIKNRLVFQ